HAEYMRLWRARDPEKYAAYMKQYNEKNRDHINVTRKMRRERRSDEARKKRRSYDLKTRYGITLEDEHRMAVSQGNLCAICRKPNLKDENWHIDHSHTTGQVRGLLCSPCNLLIGLCNESTIVLQSAIEYLNLSSIQR
ncbi:MAG: endonuclease VII domain-containing protein, partial [Nitrososphaerota archaeon]|nr:endonuclease VII domain-containing protein [Nitrososphaerota archaeon]